MKGWLVVNNFVNSEKSKVLRGMLLAAAEKNNIELEIKRTGELCVPVGESFGELPDFGIFWDKDVNLAQRLEMAGLRLFNSSRAIELCDNKVKTYGELAKFGVPFPETYCSPKTYKGIGYSNTDFINNAAKALGFPFVIKEAYGSFGQQVYLVRDMHDALERVRLMEDSEFVMQRFVAESMGRDVRINVVGDKVVASMYRYNDKDFRSNISNGGSMKKYEASDAQTELALNACRALGLDFGGVDVLFGADGKPVVCEVNSNPHFKSTFDCTGVDMSEYILKYIGEKI